MELRTPLAGPAGEPVDFIRTINSHGVASLVPIVPDADLATALTVTLRLPDGAVRTVAVGSDRPDELVVTTTETDSARRGEIVTAVRHLLRLEQDLSPFYAMAVKDPELEWVTSGAGRMMRCATVYEDVVKTICTTNCTWAATVRMVNALVEHLGEPAPGAPASSPLGRAFPTPTAMAAAEDAFYREIGRCGYRGAYLKTLAETVASGELDIEAWGAASAEELPDDELATHLLALPGVGPYATAHILMMLGRYSRLVLDSWTRPTYARLIGAESVSDKEIVARFAPYGPYAGLAFWLAITRGWVADAS